MGLRAQIQARKDTGEKVHVPAVIQFGQEVKPAETMSTIEYDLMKLREQTIQLLIGALICFGIHLKWGFTTPIVMQVVMTPMNLLDSVLAKIYIFGKAAKGDLLRPW